MSRDVASRDNNRNPAVDKDAFKLRVKNFEAQINQQASEIGKALQGTGQTAEKFARVIQTTVLRDPKLLAADRSSLWLAAFQAATDGLLPDGREAALVRFWSKEKGCEVVQYFPMVFGIIKRIRNAGEVSALVARTVFAGDHFRYWIDDSGEHVEYEAGADQDRKVMTRVFAMAKMTDGSIMAEVMTPEEVQSVRNISRSKDKGPWVEWFDQMAQKTVLRRLAKRLPMQSGLDDLLRRDDHLYDLKPTGSATMGQPAGPKSIAGRLDALAELPAPDHSTSPSSSERHERREESAEGPEESSSNDTGPSAETLANAEKRGAEDCEKGVPKRGVPAEFKGEDRAAERDAWLKGWKAADDAAGGDA